jgi:hypothetical protein
MKNDIQSIRLNDVSSLVDEFFGLDYRSNRLGLPGRWGGSDLRRLGVVNTVGRDEFSNVFTFRNPSGDSGPAHGWSADNPVVAQRLTFESNAAVSTLWALGTPAQRNLIAHAHLRATEQTMELLRTFSLLESESRFPLMGRGCLYASFLQGAAEDQTPRLRTSVFIAQQYRLANGFEAHFPLELQPGTISELFTFGEWSRLADQFGTLGLTSGTRVPDGLFSPPSLATLASEARVQDPAFQNRRLAGRELFAAWFIQAEEKGFGPSEVAQVFESAKRLGHVLRARHYPLTPDSARAVWDSLTRSGSRPSHSDHHHDSGHSL